jgi:cell division transport system ATP-binding protein
LIEFKGVHKTYDNGTKALKDVNIHIDKGEFVFIVGASGSGKSTFLKLIMREERANAGEVIVNGFKLRRLRRGKIPYLRRTMGIVFQDFRLINNMTVFDNVAFAMRVIGASQREVRKRVPYILGLVGLQDKARSFPQELSGGEQQRVGLARALVNNPSMIIADEPTGNIDPEMSMEIVELLTEINRRGTTVLMVTHEHELVHAFRQHRVIEIRDGEVVSDSLYAGGTAPVSANEPEEPGIKPMTEPALDEPVGDEPAEEKPALDEPMMMLDPIEQPEGGERHAAE